jgi:4-hydroxy 2-oxovalerate aldolase
MTITFLDCTLRDGGYYTNWMFERTTVERYLGAVAAAGVHVIEMGFRSLPENQFLGPYAHTTDALLATLPLPAGVDIAVMVNVSEVLAHSGGIHAGLNSIFSDNGTSPVAIVRLAAHLRDAEAVAPMAIAINDMGYRVTVSMMQVSRYDDADIAKAAGAIVGAGPVEALYFADSFGDMDAEHTRSIAATLRREWDGPLGVHAHDNRRLGVSNALAAIESGVTWIDGTIRGMGRGAGNAQTEFLLGELAARGLGRFDADALISVVMRDFGSLQEQHRWGPDLLYLMAAQYGVHPTYVQMMTNDPRYDLPDIVAALTALRVGGGHSFSAETLTAALADDGDYQIGEWKATGWLEGRDTLIVGAGPSVAEHRDGIENFIRRCEPAVLCLNTTPQVSPDLVTAYVACHPARLALEADRIASLDRPLVAPRAMLSRVGLDLERGCELLDYGMFVTGDDFAIEGSQAGVPARLAFAYGIAVATAAGARRVLAVGLDGYGAGDPRQDEMLRVLEAYEQVEDRVPVISLTPTTYPLIQSSVYAGEV